MAVERYGVYKPVFCFPEGTNGDIFGKKDDGEYIRLDDAEAHLAKLRKEALEAFNDDRPFVYAQKEGMRAVERVISAIRAITLKETNE